MRVLQICPKPPRPSIDGGCLAMDAITKGLLDAGCDVRVLVTSTHKHPAKLKEIDKEVQRVYMSIFLIRYVLKA